MAPEESFVAQVADGYEHLYDTVYLRTHPLMRLVPADERQSSKDVAWRLHHLLLDLIDELDPGADAPAFSREWRRYRLMVLRYCDGLHPQDVADRLAVSERSYYRELRDAIEAVATLLAERHPVSGDKPAVSSGDREESPQLDRMSLLRMEAARLASEERQAALGTVVANAVALVHDVCRDRGITVRTTLDEAMANVSVNRNALRQVLLGTLSHIIQSCTASGRFTEAASARSVEVGAAMDQDSLDILVTVGDGDIPQDVPTANGDDPAQRLAALHELGEAQGIDIIPLALGSYPTWPQAWGFRLRLPRRMTRTVLVADDNDDILDLFERYLTGHGYTMLTARDGAETIALAKRCLPDAITLDLMMPQQDGWDVLVTLTNRPETQHIPVIVCSVLGAKALSLSLGASLFLEKPVSERSLLSALAALGV